MCSDSLRKDIVQLHKLFRNDYAGPKMAIYIYFKFDRFYYKIFDIGRRGDLYMAANRLRSIRSLIIIYYVYFVCLFFMIILFIHRQLAVGKELLKTVPDRFEMRHCLVHTWLN